MDILQNVWIQIALGLLPAAVIATIFLFVKKMGKMAYVALTLALVAAVICSGVFGVMELSAADEEEAVAEALEPISKEDLMQLAYGFLKNGDTESAEKVAEQYATDYGYDDACTLLNARICVIERRFQAALGSYRKLHGTQLPREALAVEKIVMSSQTDIVLADQLAAAGHDVTVSYDADEIGQLTDGGAQEIVFNEIAGQTDQHTDEAVQWIIEANKQYEEYLHNGYYDEVALQNMLQQLQDHEDSAVLRMLEAFREARLKVLLLMGEYDAIVEYMDSYTCCAEYMTVLELYLAGLASEDDISDALDIETIRGIKKLADKLEAILEAGRDTLSDAQILKLEDQIAMLRSYDKDKALFALEYALQVEAEKAENYNMASKIYLALSKINHARGDEARGHRYFSDALVYAPASRDGDYSDAMNRLSDVVSGAGDDSLVKDVAGNAQQAVRNSYYLPGTGELIRNDEVEDDMSDKVQGSTIKYSAALAINSVDPSKFETVVLRVQISDEMISEHELKNLIRLNDCNYDIESFQIKKVNYKKSNVILCCDNSGSMDGSIGSLKNAVNKFLDNSHEKETIGFYTFDDEILQSLPLGTASEERIREAVSCMDAQGGTRIYGTLTSILSSVSYDPEASQYILLMTDGQDGDDPSTEEIYSQIGDVAARKGYVVYVLGMGSDIEVDYLSTIASSAGGQFVYAATDAQLESLYQFIHGTMQNQYEITFTAKDTLTAQNRRVSVTMKDNNAGDSKFYSVTDKDAENASVDFDEGVCVHGLSERLVFVNKQITEIFVTGTGFKSSDYMYLSFLGERDYNVVATYVDGTKFSLKLPENMAEGVYDMEVHLSGRKALYLQELTVAEGEPDEIIFGGYHFKAYKIKETATGYTLSSYVTMNNWLHFNGTVTLTGALNDSKITLTDNAGSYIDYSHTSAKKGYAYELKQKGLLLAVPALGSMTLYNATAYGTDYPTDEQVIPMLELTDLLNINVPKLRLYPDRITIAFEKGESKLPLQDFFVSVYKENWNPFNLDFNTTATITGSNVDLSGKVALTYTDAQSVTEALMIDFLDMRTQMQKDAIAFEFNTLTGFYKLGFNVKLPIFDLWVGASFWLENGGIDGFEIRLDGDVTVPIYAVPITFSDFKIGMDDYTEQTITVAPCDLYFAKLTGGFNAAAVKVSEIIKPLEKLFGDMNIMSIDASAEAQLGVWFIYSLCGKASVKLLNLIDVADAELRIGQFEHSDALLGMEKASVSGFFFDIKTGVEMQMNGISLSLKGGYEYSVTDRFIGGRHEGEFDFALDWWKFEPKIHTDGQSVVGLFIDDDGKLQFTIRHSWTDDTSGKREGFAFSIYADGKWVVCEN